MQAIVNFFLSIWFFILSLIGLNNKTKQEPVHNEAPVVENAPEPGNVQRRLPRHNLGPAVESDDEQEQIEELEKFNASGKKVGTKKMESMKAKQEKKEFIEQQKLVKEQKREKEEQQRLALEEKRTQKEIDEKGKELEAKKVKDDKEKEEYDKWRHLFSVDEAGELGDKDFTSNPQLLQEFIGFIQTQKVVVLEELAAKFGLKTKDVIDRIKSLEKDGFLTGIIDDRGKFIYITPKEMKAVVDFINLRGRISIAELAQESNQLIILETVQEKVNLDEIKGIAE